MTGKVIRIRDYERVSRKPDAVDRDPTEPVTIIVLPVIRIERLGEMKAARKKR